MITENKYVESFKFIIRSTNFKLINTNENYKDIFICDTGSSIKCKENKSYTINYRFLNEFNYFINCDCPDFHYTLESFTFQKCVMNYACKHCIMFMNMRKVVFIHYSATSAEIKNISTIPLKVVNAFKNWSLEGSRPKLSSKITVIQKKSDKYNNKKNKKKQIADEIKEDEKN